MYNKYSAFFIGAHITHSLAQECTHVLVDQLRPVKEDVLDAIVSKKPIVLSSWVEYKFRDQLQSLLEVGGAKIVSVSGFCSSSQDLEYGDNNRMVCVIPGGSTEQSDRLKKLSSFSRVNEMDLIRAVLTGWLDPSFLISACILVSSSCSTDETVVADSDLEGETATSIQENVTVCTDEAIKVVSKAETSMASEEPIKFVSKDEVIKVVSKAETSMVSEEAVKFVSETETVMDHAAIKSKDICGTSYRDVSCGITVKIDKVDESECGNSDILFSQVLVVRDTNIPSCFSTTTNNGVLNFKRFRKVVCVLKDDQQNDIGNLDPEKRTVSCQASEHKVAISQEPSPYIVPSILGNLGWTGICGITVAHNMLISMSTAHKSQCAYLSTYALNMCITTDTITELWLDRWVGQSSIAAFIVICFSHEKASSLAYGSADYHHSLFCHQCVICGLSIS
ncbi:nijmegen breakage syndrome 1 protein [Quercus suber]|uniref:Nijmegen breakage syndrome 1 protein n=1 Tax=Quercus suber TaxID=58331 RepID=A0AAW0K6J4_QUESU